MDGPILTIITRRYKRNEKFNALKRSLAEQTNQNFQHILVVDEVGIGIPATHVRLRTDPPAETVVGQYVHYMDDDDIFTNPEFVAEVQRMAEKENQPDVICFKLHFNVAGVLPPSNILTRGPVTGQIGTPCVVVKKNIWIEYRKNWGEHYAGDADYISSMWGKGLRWVLSDMIVGEIKAPSMGAG